MRAIAGGPDSVDHVLELVGPTRLLLGAELDAEMEHQTNVDTTSGPPQPMGKRGAFVADTVGQSPR